MDEYNISFKECRRCVMDTTAQDIIFDKDGVCNFCSEFLERSKSIIYKNSKQKHKSLEQVVDKLKERKRKALRLCCWSFRWSGQFMGTS